MLTRILPLLLLSSLFLLPATAAPATVTEADVVVYGGTSGGVIAAAKVARLGHSVVLIEPSMHLGGLSASGLGATDTGNKSVIGGMSREFYHRIHEHYHGPSEGETQWVFEPHVAEKVFNDFIREDSVPVVFNQRLDHEDGVTMEDGRIMEIRMESGWRFRGRMFVDATYEGDLMAHAGVTYTTGREANSQYNETYNGVQTENAVKHQFIKDVSGYVVPGDPSSGLLPRVNGTDPGEQGEADHRIQAYCFRMCATDDPENRRPWPKPENYDEAEYELLLRNFEAGDHRIPWSPRMMPNRKTDSNNNFAFSTDNLGMNYDYPEGDYKTREAIIQEHRDYQMGLMWTLANHPRVPEEIREYFNTWGLAKDEFVDNDNWPYQLYIREARRMVSDYVVTDRDCLHKREAEDPVGMGAYGMDSHNTQRYVNKDGFVRNEGDVQIWGFPPYGISYRAIVPRKGEAENLLVPTAVSASHIGYGSVRMEPVFMILGQSAATAAVQAMENGQAVQEVDYERLSAKLLEDGQVLEYARSTSVSKLEGIVVDDGDVKLAGNWDRSTSTGKWVGKYYIHDGNAQKGESTATFEAKLPKAGRYHVRMSYSSNPTMRSTVTPVTVHHADGTETFTLNQIKKPPMNELFMQLGTFRFTADKPAKVVISNKGTDDHVIADAVQFIPADE